MRLSDLSRRQKFLLGLAGLFACLGAVAAVVSRPGPELDRGALARLAAEAAEEPVTTGSLR
jgi:hypothetical protein